MVAFTGFSEGAGDAKRKSAALPRSFPTFARGPVSELAPEGELDPLLVMVVVFLRTDRHSQADDQRADRCLPLQRYTGRCAQQLAVEALVVLVRIADVHEPGHAGRVDVLKERQRDE